MRQRAKTKKKQKKERPKPIGFFKEDGKTKPIMPRVRTKRKVVRKISQEPFLGGKTARLVVTIDGEKIDTKVRWETMKAKSLVKLEYRSPEGLRVSKKYIGPKKREVWVDSKGKEWNKHDVEVVQIMPDGREVPASLFTQTKKIEGETRDKSLMNRFLPSSYLEIWGDDTESQRKLRKMAWKLFREGKVVAVEEFVKAKGAKVYKGFIYPVPSEDGRSFGLEMVVSENLKRRRRWMPAEDVEIVPLEEEEKPKKKPKVPKVW